MLAAPPRSLQVLHLQIRSISSSPYGRTHVWKRRPRTLPNPVVPKFPQVVIRADGSSFTHWTTSPKSSIQLTRDTTNNPVWNTSMWTDEMSMEEENAHKGRLGRFNRRFESVSGASDEMSWLEGMTTLDGAKPQGELVRNAKDYAPKKVHKKK
ncbi:hypothetical protein BDV98DRAFT_529700 [Pterulicium gracile]|uniref:Uncharacterized protein n=1 Tax=Pterulicium gracile TaxID=1884261 RepID=A0A5C3QMR5_9AGAR|nr:hypothetical protein BDV98DRAFT_529700 [Pterula gracilis]